MAHNSLANQRLSELKSIGEVFVPAAPNDVGSAIGACVVERLQNGKNILSLKQRSVPYWGKRAGPAELGDMEEFLQPFSFDGLVAALLRGEVLAVCRGRMEFGDRALGHRSILAHPGVAGMKDILNLKVKKREEYRPFAPVVPAELAALYFEMTEANLTMSKTYRVRAAYRASLAAITHADGSARVQTLAAADNPWLHSLLLAMKERGELPVLINTSLNMNGEPIVADELQAVDVFLRTDIDVLVLERGMIVKRDIPEPWIRRYRQTIKGEITGQFQSSYDFV